MDSIRVTRQRDGTLMVRYGSFPYSGERLASAAFGENLTDALRWCELPRWVVRDRHDTQIGSFEYWADAQDCTLDYISTLPEFATVGESNTSIDHWLRRVPKPNHVNNYLGKPKPGRPRTRRPVTGR